MRKIEATFVIGIDEAGRGPLAGPLVVAGVKANLKFKIKNLKFWNGIRDSKKLSEKKREEWYKKIAGNKELKWATAVISPKIIDKINIANSANLGAMRVYKKLAGYPTRRVATTRRVGKNYVLLDGSLYLSKSIPHKTIIKGDEKIPIISAASIIAKVTRDRIMMRFHKKFPKYRLDLHKGYGTKLHIRLIKKLGRLEVHRKTFKIA